MNNTLISAQQNTQIFYKQMNQNEENNRQETEKKQKAQKKKTCCQICIDCSYSYYHTVLRNAVNISQNTKFIRFIGIFKIAYFKYVVIVILNQVATIISAMVYEKEYIFSLTIRLQFYLNT